MKGLFVDATDELAEIFRRMQRAGDPEVGVNIQEEVRPEQLPGLLAGQDFVLNDRTYMPSEWMAKCVGLKHVIFLGTGARSYMNPEELAALGITVHIIKGYGDTAVAEHAIALMWAGARGLARMDRGVRRGQWLRTEGMQLTGKTIGLVGFGRLPGRWRGSPAGPACGCWRGTGRRRLRRGWSSLGWSGCWRRATWSACICC